MTALIPAERLKTSRQRRAPGTHTAAAWESADSKHSEAGASSGSLIDRLEAHLIITALTIRSVEEKLLDLFSQGKITGTVHTCIGQEFVGVAVAEHLQPGDYLFSNHRGHGHYLAWTDDVEGLIAELMGRTTGVCGGWGGSQHLCRDGFFSNGIQGGTMPVAGGLALAHKLAESDGIAAVFVGDGTLGQGVVYETLNMASAWSLPLLMVVEDNGIAQSSRTIDMMAGTVAGRAAAFDIDYVEANTSDPAELIDAAGRAVRHVREMRAPVLLHVHTQRLRSHSKGDDTRDSAELAALAANDPLNLLLQENPPTVREWLANIDARINTAVAQASSSPSLALAHEPQPPSRAVNLKDDHTWEALDFTPQRMNDAIRDALTRAMECNDRIVVLGEDIRDPYGGAFKVTAGLSSRWPDRVISTPISEAAIVGMANGLALSGWQPVVEIMFGDFLMLAADQIINHAAKFAGMYNGQVTVPVVIRTPMGGYRGYGPTHSQSLEKHLLGLPGTRVLALTQRYCPGLLYGTLLRNNDRPTIVIENKLLYGQRTDRTPPPGWRLEVAHLGNAIDQTTGDQISFPTIRMTPSEPAQITLVAYAGMVPLAEQAMQQLREQEDLVCELLIPTQLYPLLTSPIQESVSRTGRVMVIEEGQGFAGFGSELIAQLTCDRTGGEPLRCIQVAAAPYSIPCARSAESDILPSTGAIVSAAKRLVLADL